jgi:hypothetical protein
MLTRLLVLSLLFISCKPNTDREGPQLSGASWQTRVIDGSKQSYNEGDIEMLQVPEAPIYPTLIGGAPADRKDWPASFTTSQGSSRCTGTVIGPQVLQLAAHCVGNGKTASLKSGDTVYTGKCSHHPSYKTDATADYALCLLDKPIDLPFYEGVIKDFSIVQKGAKVLLAGMGCTQAGGGGGNDDVFRIGETTIDSIPSINNDIVTKGGAALCFGDSGGSAFMKDAKGVYKIVGINSRGDIQTTSYLSAVFTKTANDFYAKFVVDNNAKICGISDSAEKCRGDGNDPDPTPVPPWCADTLAKVNKCIYGNPRLSLSDPKGCRDEYAKLFACQVASENDGK